MANLYSLEEKDASLVALFNNQDAVNAVLNDERALKEIMSCLPDDAEKTKNEVRVRFFIDIIPNE